MNIKLINWWSGGFSPLGLSPFAYWDNGADYMASDGSAWIDRIGGNNFGISGTGHSRSTGINSKLRLVNTASGYWTRTNLDQMDNIPGFTCWAVASRAGFASYTSNSNSLQFFIDSGDDVFGYVNSGGNSYGYSVHGAGTYYILMVFDGTLTGNANRLKTWVNGVQQTLTFNATIPATTPTSAADLTVGRYSAVNLAGQIYELGMVSRAITSGEITSLNNFLASRYAL